ncbi:hypothetical protein M422DRAFT_272331 [Sphaerobolus stellatus SS14]|uniref:Uncharacterized protein n=1 Tax=Sphaerobolus stellatus (strain SS14) TaxID=990650 RepID=A0A0C9UM52_SPHS4|nr:hypothetical protein M422DRAFT_272331 [Sphaerobolus stellatus SS14]
MPKPSGSPPGRSASGNFDNDVEYVGRGTCSCTQKRLASSSNSKEEIQEIEAPSAGKQPNKRQKTSVVSKGRSTHSHQTQAVDTVHKKSKQMDRLILSSL